MSTLGENSILSPLSFALSVVCLILILTARESCNCLHLARKYGGVEQKRVTVAIRSVPCQYRAKNHVSFDR